jgi:hypothetical protein
LEDALPSRRAFLTGSATAVVLASKVGFAGTFVHPAASIDRLADADRPVAALVAHAPGLQDDALACPIGSGAMTGCLRAESLVAVTINAGGGALACGEAVEALRRQVGEDPRLGLVCWGDANALPGMKALRSAVDALALLDQVGPLDRGDAMGPSVQYHLANRRTVAARHAIALRLSDIEQTGRSVTYHWYDADPGFAAPDRPRADRTADLVWRRTAAFLRHHLAQSAPARATASGWLGG